MFLPYKPFPCLIRDSFFCKHLKQFRCPVRAVQVAPHQLFIFPVCFRKPCEAHIQPLQISRLCKQRFQFFHRIGETAAERLHIRKDCLRDALRHIPFHVGKHPCVFRNGIGTGIIQYLLRGIFPLFQELVDAPAYLFPWQERFIKHRPMHGIPGSYLYAKIIMPDGISYASGYDPPAPGPVLFADKFRIFLFCLGEHEIINNTQHTLLLVAACPQYLVHHVGRDCNLPGIKRLHALFNLPDLLLHGRESFCISIRPVLFVVRMHRKSRGFYFPCPVCSLFSFRSA